MLRDEYGVPDRRDDQAISAVWAEKCSDYHALYEAQQAELEEYGYLKSWTLGQN